MKKILYSVMALAIATMTFTACEDVPEPYPTPEKGQKQEITYEGSGTIESPYTVADAIKYAKSFGQANSDKQVYIKGFITSVTDEFNTNFGSGSFEMSDSKEGGNKFTFYRGLYLGNKKFASGNTQIKVGDEVIVYGNVVNYKGNTPETVQGSAYLYSLNGITEGGGSEEAGEATGDGTLENPFNSVAATKEAMKLASGAVSDKAFYIKGKVVSIATDKNNNVLNFDQGTFGNATFYISDDGKEAGQFYCYRILYLGNEKWTEGCGDILKVGDEVVVCAKLTMYNSTPETKQDEGYLYSLNGKTERNGSNPPDPSGDVGSIDAPKTVAEALAAIDALAEGATTDANYYVKGKVAKIATAAEDIGPNSSSGKKYSDINYYISEDGTENNTIYVYRGKNLNNTDFTAANQLEIGDEVIVYGKLQKFKDTNANKIVPQMAKGNYLVKTNNTGEGGGGQGGEEGGDSTPTSLTNGDFETWANGQPTGWQSASTASSATLAQSTDAHGGNYAVIVKGGGTQNKRLASQEITLAAGTYTFSFWVKATTENKAQVCAGYVPVTDGSVGSYKYKTGADNKTAYETISTTWSQATYEFTLDTETTLCLVVMNSKSGNYSSGEDVLVDDAKLTKK